MVSARCRARNRNRRHTGSLDRVIFGRSSPRDDRCPSLRAYPSAAIPGDERGYSAPVVTLPGGGVRDSTKRKRAPVPELASKSRRVETRFKKLYYALSGRKVKLLQYLAGSPSNKTPFNPEDGVQTHLPSDESRDDSKRNGYMHVFPKIPYCCMRIRTIRKQPLYKIYVG